MKLCKKCKVEKEDDFFYFKTNLNRLYSYCIDCTKEMDKQTRESFKLKNNTCRSNKWKQSNSFNRERANEAERISKRKTKLTLIAGYGGKCTCCGEDRQEFLSLEHLNGDGPQHRILISGDRRSGGYKVYKDVIKRGFPPEYTILCMNCNFSKGSQGYCPHVMDRSKELLHVKAFMPCMN